MANTRWTTETKACRFLADYDDHADDRINELCVDGWRVKFMQCHPNETYNMEFFLVILERDIEVPN